MERIIPLPGRARSARASSRVVARRRPQASPEASSEVSVRDTVAIVLGGGRGQRLFPLTRDRAKPAVPVGGKYRLVDVSISNCLNGGLDRIYVLTQYNSVSLHRHLAQAYRFDALSKGFVQVLAAEQTERSCDWYQGTADAVRKQWDRIRASGAREVVILSGDHLYRMDVRRFVARHRAARADVTVAVTQVPRRAAPGLGLVRTDARDRIVELAEKPSDPAVLERFAVPDFSGETFLASMGVYVFETDALEEALAEGGGTDFGQHLLPRAIEERVVAAHRFSGYWEDLGTIASYHRANLDLTASDGSYSFFSPEDPVYTTPTFLPASRIERATIDGALLSDGCIVGEGALLKRSVIGPRTIVGRGAQVVDSVVIGASAYEKPRGRSIPPGIGEGSLIAGAILDRDVRIGKHVELANHSGQAHVDGEGFFVREGIIVVPRGATIPDGFVF